MAESPQPTTPHPPSQSSTTTESSRTAAALSALTSHSANEDGEVSTPSAGSATNETADLSKAVQGLSVGDKEGGKDGASNGKGVGAGETAVEEKRKVVKVEAGDVSFLVAELELSKAKATDLLRAHDGGRNKALRAFVVGEVAKGKPVSGVA